MKRQSFLGPSFVALLVLAACGSSNARVVSSPTIGAAAMPVLAASAVPGLLFTTRALSAGELGRDSSIPGVAAKVTAWGYLDGRERTFQGESRHLTLVVSRSLVFRDGVGAGSFLAFVHDHAASFFGGGVQQQALSAQHRPGWLFMPSACACHLASPDLVGVVRSGSEVAWLEINGPEATPDLIVDLLDPSQNAPTSA
jgi:hypothetical protein